MKLFSSVLTSRRFFMFTGLGSQLRALGHTLWLCRQLPRERRLWVSGLDSGLAGDQIGLLVVVKRHQLLQPYYPLSTRYQWASACLSSKTWGFVFENMGKTCRFLMAVICIPPTPWLALFGSRQLLFLSSWWV